MINCALLIFIAGAVNRCQNKPLSRHEHQPCTLKPRNWRKTMKTLPAEVATISRRLSKENILTTTSRMTELPLLLVLFSCRYIFLSCAKYHRLSVAKVLVTNRCTSSHMTWSWRTVKALNVLQSGHCLVSSSVSSCTLVWDWLTSDLSAACDLVICTSWKLWLTNF